MPSKLLVAAAAAAHAARHAGLFGITIAEVVIDKPAVLARVRSERDRFVAGVFHEIDEIPVAKRLGGRVCFRDGRILTIGDDLQVTFRAAVIATGSSTASRGR